MNRETQDLLEKALRKRLSAEEEHRWQQLLGADPELNERFAEEAALERALGALAGAPVSSNFTARVLQAALLEERVARRTWRLRLPWVRLASGLALLAVAGTGWWSYQHQAARQAEMTANVRSFSEVVAVVSSGENSPADVFQDFEAIQRLPLQSEGELDLELLVALQK